MHALIPRLARLAIAATLLLAGACGGGGSPSSSPLPVEPASPPAPPAPQGLLSDDQLRTLTDDNAALVDTDSARWMEQSAKTVRSLTVDTDFSDLTFLADTLASKRLVMLGESSHGVKEFSQAKVRLIKYLHQVQGYTVLAFEGGLFDCEYAQEAIDASQADSALRRCLFTVWQTETLRELFEYVASTQTSSTPLRITGFDVQFSGNDIDARGRRSSRLVRKVSPSYADDVLELEQDYIQILSDARNAESASDNIMLVLNARLAEFSMRYLALADYLMANQQSITADGEYDPHDVLVAAQYARTSLYYAQQLNQRFETDSGGRARDRGMAENVIALATALYPDEKIIGWAHNAHLRHQGTGFLPGSNMGTLVHDTLESQLYTIGFYMYRGEHAFNDRSVRAVNTPLNYSLESTFYSRRMRYVFVDVENADVTEPDAAWLTQFTPTWAWGSQLIRLRLRDDYDGLFIIDTVTPPDYL